MIDEDGNVVIDETTFDTTNLNYFTLKDIVNFPTQIDYDCNEDRTKIIYTTSTGEIYMKTFVDNVECTDANDCFYKAQSNVQNGQSVI